MEAENLLQLEAGVMAGGVFPEDSAAAAAVKAKEAVMGMLRSREPGHDPANGQEAEGTLVRGHMNCQPLTEQGGVSQSLQVSARPGTASLSALGHLVASSC